MEIINWKLLSHPLNWIVLFLMVFIGLLVIDMVIRFTQSPKVTAA